jgi:formylglycine-generating enzyme required for sulfatase activity
MQANLRLILIIPLVTLCTIMLGIGSAQSVDVLEFINVPEPPNVQASLDLMLACENGVALGFNAMDLTADLGDGTRPWDISFADGDRLLIAEHPLALAAAPTPLEQDSYRFPYRGFHTFLWGEPVSSEAIVMCLAGAGTGFCEVQLPIDNCRIEPGLVAEITQIGPGDVTPVVTDQLVFEVRSYDPAVDTTNGAGIDAVKFQVIDYGRGLEVYADRMEVEGDPVAAFCAFSPDCQGWDFAANGYLWPDGEPIRNGDYLLRATVRTPDGGSTVVQRPIELRRQSDLEAVAVAGYEVTMGSTVETSIEAPVHQVTVGDFWMMPTEVTYGHYRACMEAYACTKPDDERWNDPAYADHPVVNITWQQANEYAVWAGGRLPTEAEWEAACRNGDMRIYPWGDTEPTNELANFNQAVGDTTPVGSYPNGATPNGILDLSGNVWEWTSSRFAPYPYDAADGREDAFGQGGRTVRGGSLYYTKHSLTCTTRAHYPPDTTNGQIGLRVVFDEPINVRPPVSVQFESPADGATVTSPVEVVMAAEGLIVEQAGEVHPNAGHFHILVDTDFVPAEELIPFDDGYLHFGDGSSSAQLELAPGVHTLRLQFANGAHLALPGDQYRDEITITVE